MDQLITTALPLASVIVLVLFALPSYIALLRQAGLAKGLGVLLILVLITLGLESLMLQINLPVVYSFNTILGYRIFGLVPWVMAFTYPPLFLLAFWLCSKKAEGVKLVIFSTIFSVIGLAILGAAFTRMTLIDWEPGGPLYDVPPLALIGWTIISAVSCTLINTIWGDEDLPRRTLGFSGLGILLFWSGVNFGLQQWIAGGIGVALSLFVIVIMFIEYRRRNKERRERKS